MNTFLTTRMNSTYLQYTLDYHMPKIEVKITNVTHFNTSKYSYVEEIHKETRMTWNMFHYAKDTLHALAIFQSSAFCNKTFLVSKQLNNSK